MIQGIVYAFLLVQALRPPTTPPIEFYWTAQIARGPVAQPTFAQLGEGVVQGRPGDRLQFYLSPRADAYVYLVHQDVDHTVDRLFPSTGSALMTAGTPAYLPARTRWYELGANPGRELIVLLVSSTRLTALEARLRELEAASAAERLSASRAVLDEIDKVRATMPPPAGGGRRPLAIAGRFRATHPDPATIARRITAERLFACSYIIERR